MALPSTMRLQEYTLVVVIVVLLVVGTILKPDTFLTTDNVRAMLTQASVVGVLAIGMTFVIATSGIDLSVGSVVAAAGVAGGLLIDSGDWAFVARRPRLRAAARDGQRHRHRVRQGDALRRHARHARHRPRPGAADERQEPDQPHRLRAGAVVRHRRDHRAAGVDLDLPGRDRRSGGCCSTACATAATSSSVGGNREAARIAGVPGAPHDLQRLLPLGPARRPGRHPALGSPGQRLAGVGSSCSSSTPSAPP